MLTFSTDKNEQFLDGIDGGVPGFHEFEGGKIYYEIFNLISFETLSHFHVVLSDVDTFSSLH